MQLRELSFPTDDLIAFVHFYFFPSLFIFFIFLTLIFCYPWIGTNYQPKFSQLHRALALLGSIYEDLYSRDGFVFNVLSYLSLDSHPIIPQYGLPSFRLSISLPPSSHVSCFLSTTMLPRLEKQKDECGTVSANKGIYLSGGEGNPPEKQIWEVSHAEKCCLFLDINVNSSPGLCEVEFHP